jgi:serine/threonine protein kinase
MELPGLTDLTLIGRGGFSRVYRAQQSQFARSVAVKVLDMDLVDERAQRRFVRECQATGRLGSHPSIVSVYEAAVTPEANPYIVMEFCPGGSLAAVVAETGPMGPAVIVDIGARMCDALNAAHRAGIVHRDVKPANILMTSYGHPSLADFGISVSSDASRSVGTEALTVDYAPPEVLEGQEPNARSDLYSLGVTLYTLLTGLPPYSSGKKTPIAQQLLRILRDPVPVVSRGDVPDGLRELLRELMDKDPQQRPESAADLEQRFRSLQRELSRDDLPLTARASLAVTEVPAPAPAAPVEQVTTRRADLPDGATPDVAHGATPEQTKVLRPQIGTPARSQVDQLPAGASLTNRGSAVRWRSGLGSPTSALCLLALSLGLLVLGLLAAGLIYVYAALGGLLASVGWHGFNLVRSSSRPQ